MNYILKVRYVVDLWLDTLPVFRRQVDWYRGRLLRTYLADAEKEEQAARRLYLQCEQRLQANDWIKIAHISNYLSQNASRQEEMRVRQQMDKDYESLREGADFATLAIRY